MSSTDLHLRNDQDLEIRNLSEAELEIVVQVIQRDFELKAAEKARLRRQKKQLKDADDRVTVLSSSDFNSSFCIICFRRFWPIILSKKCCYSCQHFMCRKCSCYIKNLNVYICLLCQRERSLKSMGCDWYYGIMKNRFEHDASELVAQTLFTDQGQYSFVHIFFHKICVRFKPEWLRKLEFKPKQTNNYMSPDLLQRVKGAQISQYRQKIEAKWEELEERLRILELSEINPAKRENSFKFMREEYRIKFQEILKDFSQVLYVTLENYAARLEDSYINVNEQVFLTVHEEVEQLIGYKINIMIDDMASVASDAESTTSLFGNHAIEEKLSVALVDKIFDDHSSNLLESYDFNFLDLMHPEDRSSTTTMMFKAKSVQPLMSANSSVVSRSSIPLVTNHIEVNETLASEYQQPGTPSDLSSDIESQPELYTHNNLQMSANEPDESKDIEHVLRYDGKLIGQCNEMNIIIPRGEPINLTVELVDLVDRDVMWIKSDAGQRSIIQNDNNSIEITNSDRDRRTWSNMKIWDSKLSDTGIYCALINHKPIAKYSVKIIENERIPERPKFRLEMMSVTCRSGQNAEFTVEVTGYPEPRVRFYRNNRLISPTVNETKFIIEYNAEINRHTLRILKVNESDSGIYKCRATNFGGFNESNSRLTVTGIQLRFEPENEANRITHNQNHPQSSNSSVIMLSRSNRFSQATSESWRSISPSSVDENSVYREMPLNSTGIVNTSNQSLNTTSKERHYSSSGSEIDSQMYTKATHSNNKSRDRYASSSESEIDSQIFNEDDNTNKFNTIKRNINQANLQGDAPVQMHTVVGREIPQQYSSMALPSPDPYISNHESIGDSDSDFSQIKRFMSNNNDNTNATNSVFSTGADSDSTSMTRTSITIPARSSFKSYSNSPQNDGQRGNYADERDSVMSSTIVNTNRRFSGDNESDLSSIMNRHTSLMDDDVDDAVLDNPDAARKMALDSSMHFSSPDHSSRVSELRNRFEQDPPRPGYYRRASITKRTPPINDQRSYPLTREVRIRSTNSRNDLN